MTSNIKYTVFSKENLFEEANNLNEEELVTLFNSYAKGINEEFGFDENYKDYIKPVSSIEEVFERKEELGWIIDRDFQADIICDDPLTYKLLKRAEKFNESWKGYIIKTDIEPVTKYEIKPLIVTSQQVYLQVIIYPINVLSKTKVAFIDTSLNFFKKRTPEWAVNVILKTTFNVTPSTFIM